MAHRRGRERASLVLLCVLLSLAVAAREVTRAVTHEQRELHELLHHVDNAVVVRGRLHPAVVCELLERLRDRRLVRDRDHAHPSTEHAERVHRIEGLKRCP